MTQKPYSSASPTLPGGSSSQGSFGQSQSDEGLAEHARQKAIETAGQAKEQLGGALDVRKDRALTGLGGVADALRQTTRQMRDQDQGDIAPYVERAADQLERMTGYLRSKSVGDLVDDVERFARREPALFLGGAFAVGLLTGRFLKSSSRARHGERYGEGYGRRGYREGQRYGGYDREDPLIERDMSGSGSSYGAGSSYDQGGYPQGNAPQGGYGQGSNVGGSADVGPSSVGFGSTTPGIGPSTKPGPGMSGAGAGSSGSLEGDLTRKTIPTGSSPAVTGGATTGGGSTPGIEPRSPSGRVSGGNRSV